MVPSYDQEPLGEKNVSVYGVYAQIGVVVKMFLFLFVNIGYTEGGLIGHVRGCGRTSKKNDLY